MNGCLALLVQGEALEHAVDTFPCKGKSRPVASLQHNSCFRESLSRHTQRMRFTRYIGRSYLDACTPGFTSRKATPTEGITR